MPKWAFQTPPKGLELEPEDLEQVLDKIMLRQKAGTDDVTEDRRWR